MAETLGMKTLTERMKPATVDVDYTVSREATMSLTMELGVPAPTFPEGDAPQPLPRELHKLTDEQVTTLMSESQRWLEYVEEKAEQTDLELDHLEVVVDRVRSQVFARLLDAGKSAAAAKELVTVDDDVIEATDKLLAVKGRCRLFKSRTSMFRRRGSTLSRELSRRYPDGWQRRTESFD